MGEHKYPRDFCAVTSIRRGEVSAIILHHKHQIKYYVQELERFSSGLAITSTRAAIVTQEIAQHIERIKQMEKLLEEFD